MEIWTLEQEAENLQRRFETVKNRAAFAREHNLKGGQSLIYQHITGRRPISLEAAQVYARAFNCGLEEISPRLAQEVAKAAPLAYGMFGRHEKTPEEIQREGMEYGGTDDDFSVEASHMRYEDVMPGGAPTPRKDFSLTDLRGHTPKRRATDFELVSEEDATVPTGKIEYWSAKGSCGGGFLNYDALPKGHLVKEMSFFQKRGVKPSDLFAIYADGNSMADFIVDGDIVIFDKTKTQPISGEIFLIEHPDGLRIKQLRREIGGSWVLESRNADKRAFPDERIDPTQGHLLKILGQFVYRQGG